VAVLYAAPKGYLGTKRKKAEAASPSAPETYTPVTEQVAEVPTAETPAVAEPAPSTAPSTAIYETVQPSPAPVTYAAPSTTSFGAPSIAKKPTRTYRRRTTPTRNAAAARSVRAVRQSKKK
jgi:hypothetical protein